MAKSRDGEDAEKPKARAKTSGAPKVAAATKKTARADGLADGAARSVSPTRRQVRQIARLVGRLEGLGELEARRRRQLQVALEKGRKTKRHRQQVDRAAGRVGELIDRLRTLARELELPVPAAATVPSAPAAPAGPPIPKATPKPAPKPRTESAAPTKARVAKPAAALERSRSPSHPAPDPSRPTRDGG